MKVVSKEREKQAVEEQPARVAQKRAKEEPKEKKSPLAKKAKVAEEKPKEIATAKAPAPALSVPKPPDDPLRHLRTIFVSNLSYDITEDDIRTAMNDWGSITDLRLIRDYKQRSKGYCYVEFSTEVKTAEILCSLEVSFVS